MAERHCVLIKTLIPSDMALENGASFYLLNDRLQFIQFSLMDTDIFHCIFIQRPTFDGLMRSDGNGRLLIGFHPCFHYIDVMLWRLGAGTEYYSTKMCIGYNIFHREGL